MKAKRAAQGCKNSATCAPVCRFSYYGLTFEVHGTSRELVDGVECDHGKLSVLVPQPNGLWEQSHFTSQTG